MYTFHAAIASNRIKITAMIRKQQITHPHKPTNKSHALDGEHVLLCWYCGFMINGRMRNWVGWLWKSRQRKNEIYFLYRCLNLRMILNAAPVQRWMFRWGHQTGEQQFVQTEQASSNHIAVITAGLSRCWQKFTRWNNLC